MAENVLEKLFEHNNWANQRMIEACAALTDEQLDAEPQTATLGSIRSTLIHLVSAQRGYLSLLTVPVGERQRISLAFADLEAAAASSGEALLAIARDPQSLHLEGKIQSRDGYLISPWVVMVQVINHASEHREQISSMLTALGITPPDLDGWSYGEAANAITPANGERGE